ncbi:MAG TPA: hypothetical protein VL098_14430 [Flavipsychrobacter sp.]|nr:hypothetical protein [Flavipsychrobacter sp.]
MSSFLSHIIQRHTLPAENIQPRLQGRFEGGGSNSFEPVEETTIASPAVTSPAANNMPVGHVPASQQSGSPLKAIHSVNSPASTSQHTIPEKQTAPSENKLVGDLPQKLSSYHNVELTPLSKAIPELAERDAILPTSDLKPPVPHSFAAPPTPLVVNNSTTTNTEQIFTTEKRFFNKTVNNSILNDQVKMELVENHFQALQPTPAASSVIKVSIGRIDIRATPTGTTVKGNQNEPSYKPQLSLEAYLKNRNSR